MFFTYMVKCSDGTLYTGWTTDVERRLGTHNSGGGAKYTRTRRPVKLVMTWSFPTKNEAMSWEFRVKKLNREQKLAMCEEAKS